MARADQYPHALPLAQQLVVIDSGQAVEDAVVDSLREARVNLGAPDLDKLWLVDRIIVYSTSQAVGPAFVFDSVVESGRNLLDGTPNGNLDFGDNSAPYLIETGRPVLVLFQDQDVGAVCTARIQYRVARRVQGLAVSG